MKLKLPNLPTLDKLRSLRWPPKKTRPVSRLRPPTRLQAATRRVAPPAIDEYDYDDPPTTKLSSAFFVVLILHVVAVGGIYAFNSIKAHRKNHESASAASPDANAPARGSTAAAGTDKAEVTAAPALSANNRISANPITGATGSHAALVRATPGRLAATSLAPVNDSRKADFLATRGETGSKAASPKPVASDKTYKVAKGDTIYSIAKKLGVSVDDLMKVNKIEDSKKLQIAQALKVPAKKSE